LLDSTKESSRPVQLPCGGKFGSLLYYLGFPVADDSYSLDAEDTPFMTEFASCWGLLLGSLLIALPVIWFKIKENTAVEDDLRFSDETAADVLGDEAKQQSQELTQRAPSPSIQ
jgi:hypothetical protein